MKKLRKSVGPGSIAALVTLAAVIAGCASSSKSQSPGVDRLSPLVGEFKVQRYQLSNGLKILVIEDHTSPTFAYQTWYAVGSRNEVVQYTGLAHLFEHLMFKGTRNHAEGEFDKILEGAGVEGLNAFTSHDYTAYIQQLPSSKLELIAGLEADRMVNLVVDDQSFKTEREVVQNERRMRTENSPEGTLFQELYELAYKVHPYHWPVIGYSEDLQRMTSSDALSFYRAHYAPNHATIVVSGDVSAPHVRDVIQSYYGQIPASEPPVVAIQSEPEQVQVRRKTLKLNMQVDKIVLAFRVPPETHVDAPALRIASAALGEGKSSRLMRALVDTGIASQVYVEDIDTKDPSLLIIGMSLQKGRHAAEAESVVVREVKRLGKEQLSEKELIRAKNQLRFGFIEGLNNNYNRAAYVGKFETLMGDYERGLAVDTQSQQVTAVQVQAVVLKYFNPNARTVVIGVKK